MDDRDKIESMLHLEWPRALEGDRIAINNCIVLLKMWAKRLGLDD